MSDPNDDHRRELPAYLDPRGGGGRPRRGGRRKETGPDETRVMPARGISAARGDQHLQPGPPPPGYQQGYYPPQHPAQPGHQMPPGQGYPPVPPQARPKRRRKRGKILALIVVLLLVIPLGFAAYLDLSLKRSDVLADYAGRPGSTPGTDWLLVGSDSRSDLSAQQKAELATGDAAGKRTDTIMLLHIPDSNVGPMLVSLPRDTLVDVPGHGKQKLNAAFTFGGGKLLVQTVEKLTNIRIDRYAEIGFGGFAGVVDAVGGVNMCLDQPINDPKAGLTLPAGCQTLNGAQALGYVRTRATARADLDRVIHQRQFLSALLSKASKFGTLINPRRSVPMALAATGALNVDSGTHLWHLASLGFAMGSSDLVTSTVPIGSTPTISGVGSVVKWDTEKSAAFFGALAKDESIPTDLISK